MSDFTLPSVPAALEERDYYADLELSGRVDDIEVIKKQYNKLSLENYPYKGGDVVAFKTINDAYALLIDPEKKARYDSRRAEPRASPSPGRHGTQPPATTASPSSSSLHGNTRTVPCRTLFVNWDTGKIFAAPSLNSIGPAKKFFPLWFRTLKAAGIDYEPDEPSEDEFERTLAGRVSQLHVPEEIGLGWGGYDEVIVKLARGETVKISDVPALNWHDSGPLRLVGDDGEVVELPPFPAEWMDGRKERTESLWFQLQKGPGEMTEEDRAELVAKEKKLPAPEFVGL